jgi:chromosome segregation protein
LRLKNLESEKLKYDVEEKIQDKSKIIKQIEELTKQREQLSSNISSEDINILSNYLDKMDVKSESEKDLTKLNVDLARFEEKIDAIVNDNKKSQESHIELSKQIKELKTNLEHQEKIVNSLSKEKHQFESKLVKLKSETEELEKTLVEIKNEKNHLNDFIVKGESDKEHLKESIFLKEKQLDEKIKEIKDFVEFNKNKDIDFESFDEFENKGISELRESIIDIKIELEGLGSVNLKAIADYNELFEKYGEVLQRMNILDDEKTEVLKDIEKITLEKEKVFMNFYNILRTNFKRITKEFGLGDIDFV